MSRISARSWHQRRQATSTPSLGSLQQPERIRPWLVSVAVNQAKDLLRKRKRRVEVELLANAQVVSGGVDPSTGVDSLDLLRAMDRLEPEDRALIAMRYVVGFDSQAATPWRRSRGE